jgi:hypothetical protein
MARIPLHLGNAVSVLLIAIAITLAKYAYIFPKIVRLPILVVCWFIMLYFTHCLSHYIVGRLLGVKFGYYFLSSSMLAKADIPLISKLFSRKVFLTLKITERSTSCRMFLMFLAGPLASMLSPLIIAMIALSYDSSAFYVLLLMTIANAIFTGYYSYKFGCIRKGINALR